MRIVFYNYSSVLLLDIGTIVFNRYTGELTDSDHNYISLSE